MYSLRQQEAILKKAQANCFEIVVGECNGNSKRMLSLKQGEQFDRDFAYRSVHLFDVSDQQLDNQIRVAQEAITLCNASIAVSHIMKVNGCPACLRARPFDGLCPGFVSTSARALGASSCQRPNTGQHPCFGLQGQQCQRNRGICRLRPFKEGCPSDFGG